MVRIANHVYVEPGLPNSTTEELKMFLKSSEDKVSSVFGDRVSIPFLIYVDSQKVINKYASTSIGQTYYFSWNNYIIIGPHGFNENVIAHELTHAELRERFHNKNKVPAWFDEGLAAMVDGRYTNNEVIWNQETNYGIDPINFDLLDSYKSFLPNAESYINYNLACYEVSRWFSIVGTSGLKGFIKDLNDGKDFKEQYKIKEAE